MLHCDTKLRIKLSIANQAVKRQYSAKETYDFKEHTDLVNGAGGTVELACHGVRRRKIFFLKFRVEGAVIGNSHGEKVMVGLFFFWFCGPRMGEGLPPRMGEGRQRCSRGCYRE